LLTFSRTPEAEGLAEVGNMGENGSLQVIFTGVVGSMG
jgi:hypothetical protein